jgi:transcriptional regulator with XRE-family HTH domain
VAGLKIEKIPVKYRKAVKEDLASISSALQAARESSGLTQEEFAEKVDVGSMTIQFIEQGRRTPSLAMLLLLVHALGLEIKIRKS